MKILIATCQYSYYFVSIDIKGYKLLIFHFSIHYNLMKWLVSLSYEVHIHASYPQWSKRNVLKLHSFIHHVHCCIKSWLYVILYILGSYFVFLNERWELSTRTSCKYWRMDIIVIQTEPNVAAWNSMLVHSYLERRISWFGGRIWSKHSL